MKHYCDFSRFIWATTRMSTAKLEPPVSARYSWDTDDGHRSGRSVKPFRYVRVDLYDYQNPPHLRGTHVLAQGRLLYKTKDERALSAQMLELRH